MTTAYLDHAASTPMRPEAVAALVEVAERVPGNPSGQHSWARAARRLLDDARDVVAEACGAQPGEVVFTSGGTEADNLAIAGSVRPGAGPPCCLATDHHAVLAPVAAAGGRAVGVDRWGLPDLDQLTAALAPSDQPQPAVLSVALANNEVGVVQVLAALRELLARVAPDTVLHADAVAAAAWLDLSRHAAPADLVSISGHKVGGPQGIGALIVRAGTPLHAVILGGGQERERRGGTQNVAGAVALAAALTATVAERAALVARVGALRDQLLAGICAGAPQVVPTIPLGDHDASGRPEVVANIVHVCVPGVHREALLFRLDEEGVAASAGSSCASGALEPSHVVRALGVAEPLAHGTLRLSLGWTTTPDEVARAIDVVVRAATDLRGTAAEGPVAGSAEGSAA